MNTCAGCGEALHEAAAGGLSFVDGCAVEYLLCEPCAQVAKLDPQHMAQQVALHLRGMEGCS